ncbi:TPA: hypothetical protein JFQ38_002114, partial [Legionella pneumophila]|nr:hypothetical protein [Legionella pneumophila]HAU9911433.1 hypothetical protein [Legionella pneumophila]HAV1168955.1 hypothetical protein [Legionella pneumophila]
MQSKKDDKQTKYEFGVCVKETNNENGSGHVSAFTRKTKEGKSTVTHTSFFPSALGGILQRFSLG